MEEFKKAPIAVMSNARCLNEGVDVPLVDAIAFIDPKKSIIDIVQATGRAMRKAQGRKRGTSLSLFLLVQRPIRKSALTVPTLRPFGRCCKRWLTMTSIYRTLFHG